MPEAKQRPKSAGKKLLECRKRCDELEAQVAELERQLAFYSRRVGLRAKKGRSTS